MDINRIAPILVGAVLALSTTAPAVDAHALAEIGPAPDFELLTHDNERLSLYDLRGKVVAISFIYTGCPDVCPLLTVKMVGVQKALGSDFGSNVHFVAVTMDPQVDRPEVLTGYAKALGCDMTGWSFLTGTDAEVRRMAKGYGVVYEKQSTGFIDHSLLTSIVDRNGTLRVQYMGYQFDPKEFLADLRSLLNE